MRQAGRCALGSQSVKIIIGSDHGGVELKRQLVGYLEDRGHQVCNMGVDKQDSVDYPDVAAKTCSAFKAGSFDFGILICGTGIGISISANKIAGIRCAPLCNLYAAKMAKAHNKANFIAFGGRMTYPLPVTDMVETFMQTEYEGDTEEGARHRRRVGKIADLESNAAL